MSVFTIFQTWRLRSRYAESLTKYLTGFSSNKDNAVSGWFELPAEKNLFTFLSEKLETEEDFEVKQFIIELLSNSDAPEASAVLSEQLESSEGKVRATLIAALGHLRNEGIRDLLVNMLSDVDERVVANAVLALSRYNDPALVKYVEPLLKHDNNRVRANTIISVWPYVSEETRNILFVKLKVMLIENFPRDTASALYALGEIENSEALELLCSFYELNPELAQGETMIFHQMIGALEKKGERRSVEILLQIARKSSRLRRLEIVAGIGKSYPYSS